MKNISIFLIFISKLFYITCNSKVRSLVLKRVDSIYYLIKMIIGAVAQLGERSVRNAEVVGSIPIGST
ncbi:uncharacterized protein METZ01_LOCUS134554, partial [marine metagenome]